MPKKISLSLISAEVAQALANMDSSVNTVDTIETVKSSHRVLAASWSASAAITGNDVRASIIKRDSTSKERTIIVSEKKSSTPLLDQIAPSKRDFFQKSQKHALLTILKTNGYDAAFGSASLEDRDFITNYKKSSDKQIEKEITKLEEEMGFVPGF